MSNAGWIDFKRDLTSENGVNEMFETLNYNSQGEIVKSITEFAALGQNKMAFTEGNLVVENGIALTYEGSVDNIADLHAQLRDLGYASDAQKGSSVLIQAYLCWGKDFVKQLLGSFSVVLWDREKESALLCRDRIGVKPLYYAELTFGLIFGSLPKSIFANPFFSPEFEAKSLQILLQPRLTLPGETPVNGMFEVPPAHILEFTKNGVELSEYWSLESAKHTSSFDETAAKVRSLLDEVVGGGIRSNRRLGAMLSGGLDSTSVAALISKEIERKSEPALNTYCVDFNKSEDFKASELRPNVDAPYAEEAANFLRTNHSTISFTVDDLVNVIPKTREARDLPAWGQFDASMYNLFLEMRKENDLVFSGEGADEFFGGYPYLFNKDLTNGDTFPWMGKSLRLSAFLSPEVKAIFDPNKDELERYNFLKSKVPRLEEDDEENAKMREVLFLGMSGPLQVILDRKDRMSSTVGLDMRIPFCDHRLVEYVWNIPWKLKTEGGLKGLLKKAVEDIVPISTLNRKKSAYPHNQDKDYESGLIKEVKEILADSSSSMTDIFDVPKLTEFIHKMETNSLSATDFPGGSSPAFMLVHIVELDKWMKNYNVKFKKTW